MKTVQTNSNVHTQKQKLCEKHNLASDSFSWPGLEKNKSKHSWGMCEMCSVGGEARHMWLFARREELPGLLRCGSTLHLCSPGCQVDVCSHEWKRLYMFALGRCFFFQAQVCDLNKGSVMAHQKFPRHIVPRGAVPKSWISSRIYKKDQINLT